MAVGDGVVVTVTVLVVAIVVKFGQFVPVGDKAGVTPSC